MVGVGAAAAMPPRVVQPATPNYAATHPGIVVVQSPFGPVYMSPNGELLTPSIATVKPLASLSAVTNFNFMSLQPPPMQLISHTARDLTIFPMTPRQSPHNCKGMRKNATRR